MLSTESIVTRKIHRKFGKPKFIISGGFKNIGNGSAELIWLQKYGEFIMRLPTVSPMQFAIRLWHAFKRNTRYMQGAPSFSTLTFHDFSMTKNENPWPISAQHIFPSKRYTTYECIPELVVTVSSPRSTIVRKIKPLVYLHIFIHADHVVQSAWILFSLWMYVCMFVC